MKKKTHKQIDKFTNAYKQGKHVQICTKHFHIKEPDTWEWHDLIYTRDDLNLEYIKRAVVHQYSLRIVEDE